MHEAVETGLHGKDQDREEVGMQPPPCARSLRHGSGVCGPSASSDYTHDSISSMPDVKHTGQITLCSDSKGNAFLNQYVVIGDLGQGSFSKVKLCMDIVLNRLCAVKCVNRRLLRRKYAAQGRDKGQEAIKKEIAIMKKLRHRNVVQLYEVIDDEVEDYIYLVLEYVPGVCNGVFSTRDQRERLRQCLRGIHLPRPDGKRATDPDKGEGMSDDVACQYFRETCQGLRFLHDKNVVHRDLKPENLLKDSNGRVKIADFGVSELFNDEEEGGDEATNAPVGTPAFFAPEIIRGERTQGQASDVWSLGVCLFYMVCGELPFKGSSVHDVTLAIIRDELVVPKGLPPSLRDLLYGILNKSPDARMTLDQIMEHEWVTKKNSLKALIREHTISSLLVTEQEMEDAISYGKAPRLIPQQVRTFRPGEYLVREGESGVDLFFIESGKVEVLVRRPASERNGDSFDGTDDIMMRAMMNTLEDDDMVTIESILKNSGEAEVQEDEKSGEDGGVGKKRGEKGSWIGRFFSCFCFQVEESPDAVIAERGPGELIGEMAMLSEKFGSAHSASVRAVEKTRCRVISHSAFMTMLEGKEKLLEDIRLNASRRESELLMCQTKLKVGTSPKSPPRPQRVI